MFLSFPGGSDGKESACNEGDPGSIPGLGRFPGEGNGCPPPVFLPRESMDITAWQVLKGSNTPEQQTLSLHCHHTQPQFSALDLD